MASISLLGGGGTFEVTLLPWVVLDSGAPTQTICSGCGSNPTITDYSQSWDMSLMFAPTVFGDFIGRLAGA